jgi:O-acetylserine/cysteine efflux transporter
VIAAALGKRPTPRQWLGSVLALAGLAVIGQGIRDDLPLAAFLLTLASPLSFGLGNVLFRRLPSADTASLVAWLSLVPPLPAVALSVVLDGPVALPSALIHADGRGWVAALYLGFVATSLAYAIWGCLLRRYPAATVAPFALLVPFVAAAAAALVFGERFGPLRLAGMTLVLAGLACIVLSVRARR